MNVYQSGLEGFYASKKWVIHFVGIGGVGMSGIAEVLQSLGYNVRGSDLKESETTERLRKLGIHVTIGHIKENIENASVVVISSAVSYDNIEIKAAQQASIPVIPRAEMLAELARLKHSVLVAGAHGKTTTTSLISTILSDGNFDPTVIIGGKLKALGSNARMGLGEFLVAEADESDGTFLKLSPTIAVVTNIDREHMDYFKTIDALKRAFIEFINKVPFYGTAILCLDDSHLGDILPHVHRRTITYGLKSDAALKAINIYSSGLMTRFEALFHGKNIGSFTIPLPGVYNVSNALAALAAGIELEIDFSVIRKSLENFSGIHRRFEFKGEAKGIRVFDDYAHHPSEIKAVLGAAQSGFGKRVVVLFQPHRYTRTRDLLTDFYSVFNGVDKVIITDIYAASEKPLDGIHSGLLCDGLKQYGQDVEYLRSPDEIINYLIDYLRPQDMVITLGAGNIWKIGEQLLKRLQS